MQQILETYLEQLNICGASPHTIRSYKSDINQFLQCANEKGFDPLKLDRITARLYLGFLAEKYQNKATIMRHRDSIKSFYGFLEVEKVIKKNPFRLIPRMRVEPPRPPFLNQEDAAKLIDSISVNPDLMACKYGDYSNSRAAEAEFLAARDRAAMETIYSCGLRAQETVNLNWIDIDFRAGYLRVNSGKGNKDRVVPIGERAIDSLWAWGAAYRDKFEIEPKGASPIFLSRRRVRITTRSLQRAVELRLKLAGIDTKMGPHALRHSFATHMLQGGGDIVVIAECLGHSSLSTTQKYTHLAMVDIVDAYTKAHPRA